MDETSLSVIAIIALLLSVIAIGYTFLGESSEVDVSEIESDISGLTFDISSNKLGITELQKDITECNKDLSDLDLKCYCDVDEDDFEDLIDDVNDVEDDIDDLQDQIDDFDTIVEDCFQSNNNNWTIFKNCIESSFY